jgi:hypothetical protein
MGKNDGELMSNCCAWDFDPFGYEKEEGIYQERCLKCGKLCEPLYISKRNIDNIHRCKMFEADLMPPENSAIIFYAFRYALGRKTYVVAEVVNHIVKNWTQIHPCEREAMKNEVAFSISQHTAGMPMDVEQWERILAL